MIKLKKRGIFLTLLLMMLSFPVLVKAENKVYFELDEVNIAPSEEKKINVKVDSNSSFSLVNFSLNSESSNFNLQELTYDKEKIKAEVLPTGEYKFESKNKLKSGTIIATLIIKAKGSTPLGTEAYIELYNATIDNNKKTYTDKIKLITTTDKSKNNDLKSLTSKLVDIDFSKDVTEYKVKVDKNATFLDLEAQAEDEKSSVTISSQDLKEDVTDIIITVTSEFGEEKQYKVTVQKLIDKKVNYEEDVKNIKKSWITIFIGLSVVLVLDLIYLKFKK